MNDEQVQCFECEYDLRGLAQQARCPECGTEVGLSLRRHELIQAGQDVPLTLTSGRWLWIIAWACSLIILGGLIDLIAIATFVNERWYRVSPMAEICAGTVWTVGYFMLGLREPASPRTRWTRLVSITARLTPVVSVLFLAFASNFLRYSHLDLWTPILVIASVLIAATHWVLMHFLENLTRRAGAKILPSIVWLLKWVAPAIWLCQPFISPNFEMWPSHWFWLRPHTLLGYTHSLFAVPYTLIDWPRLNFELITWTVELLLTLYLTVALFAVVVTLFRVSFRTKEIDV